MKLRVAFLFLAIFSLFGSVFLISPSYAGTAPSFGASESNQQGREDDFKADEFQGERSWTIPNHVISLDTNAGPWKKNLLPVGGTGSVPVDDSIDPGTSQTFFLLEETITVKPEGGSFTGWHEEIVNPGWIWEYSDLSTEPRDILVGELQVTGDGTNSLTICFEPPLPPGTEFLIEKSLVFVGPDGMLSRANDPDLPDTIETSSFSDVNPLIVLQYPTDVNCDVQTDVDHYLGYEVGETKDTPKFKKRNVKLSDQFEDGTFEVKKPVMLYNPVDKNGEGISDESTHLVGYQIKGPRHKSVTDIEVVNQFGTITVDTKKADLLLVPSAKSTTGPIGKLVPPITVDHFKCFKVKVTSEFDPISVDLRDQFQEKTFLVIKPTLLCNPVNKNGEGINNGDNHLMCYKLVERIIWTNNQFEDEVLEIKTKNVLCVPSMKTLL